MISAAPGLPAEALNREGSAPVRKNLLKTEVPLALLNAERVHGRPVVPKTEIVIWQLLMSVRLRTL